MVEKTRIGIIGLGYWGPNLARNFDELEDAKLVAIADLSTERLEAMKRRFPDAKLTTDFNEFPSMGIQAVAIATPPKTHFRIAKACIEAGLHVLVEKPLTLKQEDSETLIELAREHDRVLMTGHTFLYNPAIREIRRYIQEGELGEIYYIDAVRTNLGLFQLDTDAMWDLAPHDISIANYVLDSYPDSVMATGGSFIMRPYNLHDVVYMHIRYPNGVICNVRVSWLDPNKARKITIVGSKKMLVYDDIEPLEKIRIYDKGVSTPPLTDTYGEFRASYRYGAVTIPHVSWHEPLRIECQHFIDCINNGTNPVSDGLAGKHVVEVLEAGSRSLISGQEEIIERAPVPV